MNVADLDSFFGPLGIFTHGMFLEWLSTIHVLTLAGAASFIYELFPSTTGNTGPNLANTESLLVVPFHHRRDHLLTI